MAYVALYRAYRPKKFSEVVGQEHIITTLQNAIKLNKVAHAYLFCGPRGTGKTTFAKILAKAMNCEKGPIIEPCCECEMCKNITKGSASDVVEIDAASNNGADDIRALRDTVNFMPAVGKYKIYIIDEVHMLTTQAFNALLKTLEEPPKHVIFILATTEPHKLPATILSRCQRFDFQSISIENIIKRLNVVKQEENINITDEALYQIAISAEGGMRDALSLLDQAVSFSVNDEISIDDILAISGSTSYNDIIELLSACIDENESNAIIILDKILKKGKEVPRLINDIILFLRDTLLFINNAYIEAKIMYKNDKFKMLVTRLSKGIIYAWLDILNQTLNNTKFSVQKRAFLELAILKMNDVKLNEEAKIPDRITALERNIDMLTHQMAMAPKETNRPMNYNANIPTPQEIERLQMEQKRLEEERRIKQEQFNKEIKTEAPKINQEVVSNNKPKQEQNNNVEIKQETIIQNKEEKPKDIKQEEQNIVAETDEDNQDYSNRKIVLAPPNEINVLDIEKIINNNEGDVREQLIEKWNKLENIHTSVFEAQILSRGRLVAVSKGTIVVILNDVAFCNRVMSYETSQEIIKFLHENDIMINDYICIPRLVWREMMNEYVEKKKTTDKPEFEDRRIGVKRRIKPEEAPKEEAPKDETMEILNDLFPNGSIKIV